MTPQEYANIAAFVYSISPCNMLVFGCGDDSLLWSDLNWSGHTLFLEDAPQWATKARTLGLKVIDVLYSSKLGIWMGDVDAPAGIPSSVYSLNWDIILVDAPIGIGDSPGREQSILLVGKIRDNCDPLIYVHDVNRPWEAACCDKYLGSPNERIVNLAIWRPTNRATSR